MEAICRSLCATDLSLECNQVLYSTDACDLVQDVLTILVSKLSEFEYDPPQRFRGCLRTVPSVKPSIRVEVRLWIHTASDGTPHEWKHCSSGRLACCAGRRKHYARHGKKMSNRA